MAKRYHNQGEYAGMDARRTQEMQDAGMIKEDRSAVANLPQEVIMKEYPKRGDYLPEMLDDTIKAVDGQMALDNAKRQGGFAPKKV